MLPRLRPAAPPPLVLALAGPFSGPEGFRGPEMERSVRHYLAEVNRTGGVGGRPVELRVFDDGNDARRGRDQAEAIARSPAVLVLGHASSNTVAASSPVYLANGLPALSGNSALNETALDNPFYFSLRESNTTLGRNTATYVRHVLGRDTVSLVQTTSPTGRVFGEAFADTFDALGTVEHRWRVDTSAPDRQAADLDRLADDLAAEPEPGLVVLSATEIEGRDVLAAVRRHGLRPDLFGTISFGSDAFAALFAGFPEERSQPGYFTTGLYALAPVLYDSGGAETRAFASWYAAAHGQAPTWRAARYYDAARVAVHALRAAGLGAAPAATGAGAAGSAGDLRVERSRVRAARRPSTGRRQRWRAWRGRSTSTP